MKIIKKIANLIDQFGEKIKNNKAPSRHPLPSAPLMDSWREYVTSGLTPERLAKIFIEADAGDVYRQSELFDQMEEKDGHLLGEKGKRVNIIQTADFKVEPATEDKKDIQIADFVQSYFDNMPDFDDVLVAMQDAVGKGFACLEINWDVTEGQALPRSLDFIEQKRFIFYDQGGTLRRKPLLITDNSPMGVEIPEWKVLFHKYGGKSGHPTKSGIYRVCAWNFLFKNYSIKDWVIFCEVYGMPLRLGKYDMNATEDDRAALYQAISSLGSDAAGIISKETEIEFIQAANGASSAELYESLAGFCNKEISKALLGQTLSADIGSAGSYAAAKTHDGVRVDLLKADIKAAATTLRNQLIRPIVGFNFGWDALIPQYVGSFEVPEDLKAKAEWVCSLLDRKIEMPLSFVRHEFKIPEQEKNEPMVGTPDKEPEIKKTELKYIAKSTLTKNEDFSAETAIEAVGEKAIALADSEGLVKPVKELLHKCKSLSEFKSRLLEAHAGMDDADLGELMARALMLANVAGRDI